MASIEQTVRVVNLRRRWLEVHTSLRSRRDSWTTGDVPRDTDWFAGFYSADCAVLASETAPMLRANLFGANPVGPFEIDDGWTRAYAVLITLERLAENPLVPPSSAVNAALELEFVERLLDLARLVLASLSERFPNAGGAAGAARGIGQDRVDYTEALINIIGWHAHRFASVPVDLPLADALRAAYRAEAALQALKPFYRDHLFHAIDVCMLGHYLITSGTWPTTEAERDQTIAVWFVASLFHDVGYIIELVQGSLRALQPLEAARQIRQFSEFLQTGYDRAIQDFCDTVCEEVDPERRDCVRSRLDHGAASAAYLTEHLDRLGDRGVGVRDAVHAILAHSLHPEYPLSQRSAPISALLVLCDELQEWGRSAVEIDEYRRQIASARGLRGDPFEPFRPLEKLTVTRDTNGGCRFDLHYRSPERQPFDVAWVWIGKTSNLQRVAWQAPVADWRVCIRVPPKEPGLREMDVLRSCAWNDSSLVPLRRWLEAVAKRNWFAVVDGNECIEFSLLEVSEGEGSIIPATHKALETYAKRRAQQIAEWRSRGRGA